MFTEDVYFIDDLATGEGHLICWQGTVGRCRHCGKTVRARLRRGESTLYSGPIVRGEEETESPKFLKCHPKRGGGVPAAVMGDVKWR